MRLVTKSTHAAVADDRNADVQIYINGDFFHRTEAKISVFDSGFLVGDGIWEGIRLHHGEFAFLNRHLDRLFASAKAIHLDIGTRDDIVTALQATIDQNGMDDNVHIRLMITRGDKKTPSQHPSNTVGGPNVVIIAEHKLADPTVATQGISLFTATVRRPGPDVLDQNLNCHSKLHEVIALIQAVGAGADEAPDARCEWCRRDMQCDQLLHREEGRSVDLDRFLQLAGDHTGSCNRDRPGGWYPDLREGLLADRRVCRRRGLRDRDVRWAHSGTRGRRPNHR